MKLYFAVIAAAALIGTALPACAEEIAVGVGPVGVTVGQSHRDRDVVREREVIATPSSSGRATAIGISIMIAARSSSITTDFANEDPV